MGTCCNPDCNYFTKKTRCGKCRKRLINNCSCCNNPISNPNKMYCNDCAAMSKLVWAREYRRNYNKNISKEKRIIQNQFYYQRKKINNSVTIVL